MQKEKPVNEPLNLGCDDTHETRLSGEARATGLLDGRTMRGRSHNAALSFKVSTLRKQQVQQLALRLNISMTAVLENALDVYEQKLNSKGAQ
jgi:hypothetical protein